jgi:hypothetical protein
MNATSHRILAYLHDLLLVELPLLSQVIQLAHVLQQHRSQAVIGHRRARWILECISECGDDICCVRGGPVGSHGKVEYVCAFPTSASHQPFTDRSGRAGKHLNHLNQ